MALFGYTAVNQSGHTIRGRLEAQGTADLESRLSRLGLQLVSGREIKSGAPLFQRKVGKDELAQFCFYLEQLVAGGVPLLEGLSDVRDSVSNPSLRYVVGVIIQEIEQGSTLSDALRKHPKIFDEVFVSLVEAGEESGELATVLKNLGDTIKWQAEMRKRTVKVFMYPLFALLVMIGAAGFLLGYVVPKITTVLASLGQELPVYTIALINTADFIINNWQFILIAPVVVFFAITIGIRTIPGVDYYLDKMKVRFPIFGVVAEKIILSRFANIFGLLYASGINVIDSLKISQGALGNRFIGRGLGKIIEDIINGSPLTEAFKVSGIFPPLVLRMLRLGETTGGIDASMQQVKSYYDKDAVEAIEAAQAAIGPLMLFVIAGLLIWIILAVYFPLYDLVGKVGAG